MNTLVFFHGMGGNSDRLKRILPENWEVFEPKWPTPASGDTLASYVNKALKPLSHKPQAFLGYSFGALMALEAHKSYPSTRLLLLSCAVQAHEQPWAYDLLRKTRLLHFLPDHLVWQTVKTFSFLAPSNERRRYKMFLDKTPSALYAWALRMQLETQLEVPHYIWRLHGLHDTVFPKRYIHNTQWTEGGHLLLETRTEAVANWLNEGLKRPLPEALHLT